MNYNGDKCRKKERCGECNDEDAALSLGRPQRIFDRRQARAGYEQIERYRCGDIAENADDEIERPLCSCGERNFMRRHSESERRETMVRDVGKVWGQRYRANRYRQPRRGRKEIDHRGVDGHCRDRKAGEEDERPVFAKHCGGGA